MASKLSPNTPSILTIHRQPLFAKTICQCLLTLDRGKSHCRRLGSQVLQKGRVELLLVSL
ncbi:hypothetical protein LB506_002835 [Fusarium annulatum]|nr:hypothetical protein LB506_002835 [Fusarium annulatum]